MCRPRQSSFIGHWWGEEPRVITGMNYARVGSGGLWALHSFDEDHAGEWNRAASLCEFTRSCGVADDEMVVFVLVESAAAGGVINRQCFRVLKVGDFFSPLRNLI